MEPVIVTQNFSISETELWRAITEVEQMKKWFFAEIIDFNPIVGFFTRFNVGFDNKNYMHLWKITEVRPKKRITYNWKYESFSGDSYVTFDIHQLNGFTQLTLSHYGWETFPQDVEDFSYENCVDAWKYFIQERLVNYVNSL